MNGEAGEAGNVHRISHSIGAPGFHQPRTMMEGTAKEESARAEGESQSGRSLSQQDSEHSTPKVECTPRDAPTIPMFSAHPAAPSDRRGSFRTPNSQVVKRQKSFGDTSACACCADPGIDDDEEVDEKESSVLKELEKVCLELAAVEVALRRYSTRSEFQSSPTSKVPNQVVYQAFEEYKSLSQQKRALLSRARKLRRSIYTFKSTPALKQQVQYVDFALSVTTTIPGLNDLEDDQLRRIFTEILRLSNNCPTSMMSLSRVCKRWGKLVRSADVWKALHLNRLAHSVADHELLVLLGNDKAFSKVSSISLANCVQVTEKSLLPILQCCGSNLTNLDISGCWLLTKRTLEVMVECCPKLTQLNMSRCSGIMLDDALDIIGGTAISKTLQRLGIAYMGGVCRRIARADFESTATKMETFLLKQPNISVGNTQSFFRLCMTKLEEIPQNVDQSMCQAPYCSMEGDHEMAMMQCGHVVCLRCESVARGNVRTVNINQAQYGEGGPNGANSTVGERHYYPCPTCGQDMGPPSPCSKSFVILL